MRIGIIGGGITGLASAYYLSKNSSEENKNKTEITIFEPEELGGLAGSFKMGNSYVEKYYHHFFRTDKELVQLAKELGLEIYFNTTKVGFYYNKIYPFSKPLDILRFGPLAMHDRIRLAFLFLYFQNKKKWNDLEGISVKNWIIKYFGEKVYENYFCFLLETKFGKHSDNIPAAWLWGRIYPRSRSRRNGVEELGYLKQGFHTLVDKLIEKINDNKVNGSKLTIIKRAVKKIAREKNGLSLIDSQGKKLLFDAVISTIPNPLFLNIVSDLPKDYQETLQRIKYRGVVCMVLRMKKSISDLYWLNNCNKLVPFGGVIEHTNFAKNNDYGGKIVYLFNYADINEKIFNLKNDELFLSYLAGIKQIFPSFDENNIIDYKIFRDKYATPVYELNYSKMMPSHLTPIEGLFIANTSQIYPDDRNVSNSIHLAKKISNIIGHDNKNINWKEV